MYDATFHCRCDSPTSRPVAIQFHNAHRTCREAPFHRVSFRQQMFARLKRLEVDRTDFLAWILGRYLEHAASVDHKAVRRKRCFGRAGVIHVRDVEKNLVAGAACTDVETRRSRTYPNAL